MRSGMQWKSRIRSWLPWSIALPAPSTGVLEVTSRYRVLQAVVPRVRREYTIVSAILPHRSSILQHVAGPARGSGT